MDELMQGRHALNIEDLSDRPGFDEQFLGARVGVPALDGLDSVLLPYTHFSVLMRPCKRLAAVTALGMDGIKLIDLDRSGIQWRLDPRLREDQQTGEAVSTPATTSAAATSSAGHQQYGAPPGGSCPGQRGHVPLHERSPAGGNV